MANPSQTLRITQPTKPLRGSLKIATISGIPVLVHWSFLALLPIGHYYRDMLGLSRAETVWWASLALAVFTCILLHELGHALAAKWYGIRTRDIVLFPIGGMARLDRLPDKPLHEMFVALAGPLANVGIAAALLPFFWILTRPFLTTEDLPTADNIDDSYFYFLPLLLFLNLLLAAFNLIPAFPMDGGRVLRALLAIRLGRVMATKVALFIGLAFAGWLLVDGIAGGRFSYLFISLFIAYTAIREYGWVKTEHLLTTQTVAAVCFKDPIALSLTETLDHAMAIFNETGQQGFLVTDSEGNTVGTLDISEVQEAKNQIPRQVKDFYKPDFFSINPSATLKEANELMQQKKRTVLAVVENDVTIGVLVEDKIWESLEGNK